MAILTTLGSGHFLSVKHPSLPQFDQTPSEPAIVGHFGEIQAGFVVFLGQGALVLECHTWGPVHVPPNFRELNVVVTTPPVNVVDLQNQTRSLAALSTRLTPKEARWHVK